MNLKAEFGEESQRMAEVIDGHGRNGS